MKDIKLLVESWRRFLSENTSDALVQKQIAKMESLASQEGLVFSTENSSKNSSKIVASLTSQSGNRGYVIFYRKGDPDAWVHFWDEYGNSGNDPIEQITDVEKFFIG